MSKASCTNITKIVGLGTKNLLQRTNTSHSVLATISWNLYSYQSQTSCKLVPPILNFLSLIPSERNKLIRKLFLINVGYLDAPLQRFITKT